MRRHYIRINPTDPAVPDPHADPNTTMLAIANGGGFRPAMNVVGGQGKKAPVMRENPQNNPPARRGRRPLD